MYICAYQRVENNWVYFWLRKCCYSSYDGEISTLFCVCVCVIFFIHQGRLVGWLDGWMTGYLRRFLVCLFVCLLVKLHV